MRVYDKAIWHIDNGENRDEVLRKFETIFDFLAKHKMLTDEGVEIYELGADESWAFYDRMLTEDGNQFMEKQYDHLLTLDTDELQRALKSY